MKFQANTDWYPTKMSRMLYTSSRLEGSAANVILPYIDSTGKYTLENNATIIEILEMSFGDPDRRGTALRELWKLYQGNREIS